MSPARPIAVSFVIPVYNEEENLPELYKQVISAADKLGRSFEVILVDDGSKDGSFPILKGIQAADPRVKVIRLRKNFGQTAALSAGFDLARGEVIVTLDADLQNDPADTALLLDKMDEGYDIVSGWRVKRKDKLVSKRLPSKAANWIISRVTGVKLHDYGCTLKAFRSEIVKHIKLYGEMHRFIPAIASTMGTSIAEVPVNHRPRIHGKSKYNLSKSVRVFLDLLTVKFLLSYSTRPLQIFGLFGLIAGGIGGVIGLALSYQRLVLKVGIGNRPLLLLAVILIVIGFQFVTMGLLGEIMVRTYHEAVEKHIYVVRDVLDADAEPKP
jgi:glycosyltransferase involved in cell wall biosynthesis